MILLRWLTRFKIIHTVYHRFLEHKFISFLEVLKSYDKCEKPYSRIPLIERFYS